MKPVTKKYSCLAILVEYSPIFKSTKQKFTREYIFSFTLLYVTAVFPTFIQSYVAFADLFILIFSHLEGILHRTLSHGTGGFPKGCRTCRGQFEEKRKFRKPTSSRSSLLLRFVSCKPVIHYELLLDAMIHRKNNKERALYLPMDAGWEMESIAEALGVGEHQAMGRELHYTWLHKASSI